MNEKVEQKISKAKDRAMLEWVGKKPLEKIDYYPAQEKEVYGNPDAKEFNKLIWGDNLQVLAHLLKEYRGKVDLIYIDPPFDSKADYIKKIKIRGEQISGEQQSLIEQKQYGDIWKKDEYLQFMYERLLIMRELLSDKGSIYLHCDHNKEHYLRIIMEEIFGQDNFLNAICWKRGVVRGKKVGSYYFPFNRDMILIFSKNPKNPIWKYSDILEKDLIPENDYKKFGYKKDEYGYYIDSARNDYTDESVINLNKENRIYVTNDGELIIKDGVVSTTKGNIRVKAYRELSNGFIVENKNIDNVWDDIKSMGNNEDDLTNYPTQKPEALLERIIKASSNEGDLVADFFCGSGTTLAVAEKLKRRWIGSDINKTAIQTAVKRLTNIQKETGQEMTDQTNQNRQIELGLTGKRLKENKEETRQEETTFKVLAVNDYEVFKNELEAKEIIIESYKIEKIPRSYFDGKLGNDFVKVMPINRVLNKKDIAETIKGIEQNIGSFTVKQQSKKEETLYQEKVLLICSGYDSDILDYIKKENKTDIIIEIKNILQDKKELNFKSPSEAEIEVKEQNGKLFIEIKDFFSPLLMQKLAVENNTVLIDKTKLEDFRQAIDSIAIDLDYIGELFNAEIVETPSKNELIKTKYEADKYDKIIAVKIIDVLGEEYFESFKL